MLYGNAVAPAMEEEEEQEGQRKSEKIKEIHQDVLVFLFIPDWWVFIEGG